MAKRTAKVMWMKKKINQYFEQNLDGVISTPRLIGRFVLANNSTTRTAKECLKILSDTDFIILTPEIITLTELSMTQLKRRMKDDKRRRDRSKNSRK